MKILVVDDSKAMRMIVMRAVRQAGFEGHEMVEAENGAAALELIKSSGPDLVLCDWNMPEMNGIELLDALRAANNPVRFGFVTSEGSAQMRQRAEESGALFLIAKPFTPEAFREALAPVLA